MNQSPIRFHPRLEVLEDRLCPSGSTVILPISAFLSQQGTTSVFTPPVPDQLGWSNSAFDPGTTSTDPSRFLLTDYTGQAAKYLLQHGINLHTSITGYVTETPEAGGLMEVSVNLEARNALTWVANVAGQPSAFNTAPLELGYRAQDLVANPTLKPALSDVHFQIIFSEQAGPLPDLAAAFNEGIAPPGLALETYDFQSWGAGTLDAGTTVGTPGQPAFVRTSQIGDFTQPNLPGTLGDGAFQEPIDIVPVQSPSAFVAALNGTLFITDLHNGNDNVVVVPAGNGAVAVYSNLGGGTYSSVQKVVVSLSDGNNNVVVGSLPGVNVNVTVLDGNNNIVLGNEATAVISGGGGNDNIVLGNASVTQQVFVGGNGNNNIIAGRGDNVITVAGSGNNNIVAAGSDDLIEVLGNGNNNIIDVGTADMIVLGGDGNNNIVNHGVGSFTHVLHAKGHNNIVGPFGP